MSIAREVPMLSSIFIYLTQWYRTKLRAVVPNTNNFKSIILKFKTLIYDSDCKIIYNFCIHGDNTSFVGEKVTPGVEFFYRWYFQNAHLKYAKRMVELYICDNLN